MARILVLGATGMLGHKLCQDLPKRGHTVFATVRKPYQGLPTLLPNVGIQAGIDVLERDSVVEVIRNTRPDFIINAIGIVKQLGAASDKYLSTAINSWLPQNLVQLAREGGCRLIHISTDCVFDGVRGRYTEADPSNAQDLYGKSKWLGEPDPDETSAITLRTSIIGRELSRPTHGLVEWFLAQQGSRVRGFARAVYSGFTTIEIARVVALVVEKHPRLHGLFHVSSNPINKFDLLSLLREGMGLSVDIERNEEFVCDRSLIMKPFAERTGYVAPDWPAMIREMCADPTPYERIQNESVPR